MPSLTDFYMSKHAVSTQSYKRRGFLGRKIYSDQYESRAQRPEGDGWGIAKIYKGTNTPETSGWERRVEIKKNSPEYSTALNALRNRN